MWLFVCVRDVLARDVFVRGVFVADNAYLLRGAFDPRELKELFQLIDRVGVVCVAEVAFDGDGLAVVDH